MSITHFGNYDLIELPSPATYTPAGGIVTTRRVRMLKTTVPAYTAGLAAAGYGWELNPDDNTPYAVVTTIASPDLTATWTLDGNDIEQSIWLLPKVRAVFNLIPDLKTRAKIRDEIERLVRGEYTEDEAKTVSGIVVELTAAATGQPGPAEPSVYGEFADIVNGLIGSLVQGVESFPVSTYVLRKTQVLNPLTNVSPGFEDSNKALSLSALVVREPGIPLNIAGVLTGIGGYWQKKTPQASQAADGRWTYTVEYWHADRVDPFLYQVIE
jgi:hypothetical protein